MRTSIWVIVLAMVVFAFGAVCVRAAQEMNDDAVQALIKSDPVMHFALKDKSGNDLAMNKWSKDKISVFVLTEKGKAIKTVVADASLKIPAVFKDQEYRILRTPATQREVDGKTVAVPAVYEGRTRKVCASPEHTDYTLNGKTVLQYTPYEVGHDTDKLAPLKGKLILGADEYDVVDAFNIVNDR